MRIESLRDLLGQFPDNDGIWTFNDLSDTEKKIRTLLGESEAGSVKVIELLTQLARVQGLVGNLTEAAATLLLVNDLLTKHESGAERARIRFFIEQGRFFGLSMNPPQSLSYFSKAWELAAELGDPFFSIETAVMLSISQPPKSQNEWLQEALKLAEESQNENGKSWLAQIYLMHGWHAFDFRRFEEAHQYFEKALARAPGANKNPGAEEIRWAIGRALRALNQPEAALAAQRALEVEMTSQGKVNGHVYLEIAECFQLLKNYNEARTFFELAYKELSLNGWYTDNKSSELSRMRHLSKKK